MHSLKAFFPIDVTDGGISTFVSEKHFSNAQFPIDVIDGGIFILLSDEH